MRHYLYAAIPAIILQVMLFPPASVQTVEERRARGDAVIRTLNKGEPQPALEAMREEFTILAEATEAYALGDVWSLPGLDKRTRQLAAVAAFAAIGETGFMQIHAGYALNAGAKEEELKEVIYMVTVPAGFPKAISGSQALSDFSRRARQGRTRHKGRRAHLP